MLLSGSCLWNVTQHRWPPLFMLLYLIHSAPKLKKYIYGKIKIREPPNLSHGTAANYFIL